MTCHNVQNQLKENDTIFHKEQQLVVNTKDEFDVIYLSSVSELMSYCRDLNVMKLFAMLDKSALKPDGVIIIRDWGYGPKSDHHIISVTSSST